MTNQTKKLSKADPLDGALVGGTCVFNDDTWYVPNPVQGQPKKSSTIKWAEMALYGGKKLTDTPWKPLLREFRVLVYTMLKEPCEGTATSPGSLSNLAVGIKAVATWMSRKGLRHLSELDCGASWDYLEYYCSTIGNDGENDRARKSKLTFQSTTLRLMIFAYIWRQRTALRRHGVEPPREPPFDGRNVNNVVVEDLNLRHGGKLLPIPDDVVVPMLNEAFRLIGEPANDVERLVRLCRPAFDGDDQTEAAREQRYKEVAETLRSFEFQTLEGESKPWYGPLVSRKRTLIDGRETVIDNIQLVRRLVMAIQQAAISTIQGCTGLRGNELCAMMTESGDLEFPSCIERRLSADGLLELFYVSTVEGKVTKRRLEWVIGSRPMGSTFLPPPLRAFQVLHKLFDPWRTFSSSKKLLITFSAAKGLPRSPGSIGEMSTQALTVAQKEFVREWVDLSGASRASRDLFETQSGLRGQQWRTTFALHLIRIDSRFLQPISTHFKHLSVAMTQKGYVGTDVTFIATLDDVRTTETARFFLQSILPGATVAGNMAKLIDEHRKDLNAAIGGLTLKHVRKFVVDHDIRIFNFSHGMCFLSIRPQDSRCNHLGGTAHWSRRAPNFLHYGPSVCPACPLYVADASHLPFWRNRQRELRESLRISSTSGSDDLRVVRKRLQQAEAMIRVLSRPASNESDRVRRTIRPSKRRNELATRPAVHRRNWQTSSRAT